MSQSHDSAYPLDGGFWLATPLSRQVVMLREIGGFASPPHDGFALERFQ